MDEFANFELRLQWRIERGGNSGIMYRVSEDLEHSYESGPEMQVLDVPGVAKEDVKVTIDGKRVSVEAASAAQAKSGDKDGQRLIYRERASRRFARSFTLPEALDQTASSAKLENGVLTLTLQRLALSAQAITVN